MATAAPTRTEQVYARMRADILAGHWTPGAKLPFAELVARYGGSTSVIREGLTRLVEQGLVQAEPQHGFRVVPLSISDLDDLTTARCELEGLVLRLSIEAGDLEWESAIVAAHHTLERTPMTAQRSRLSSRSTTRSGRAERRVALGPRPLPQRVDRRMPERAVAHDGVVVARRGRAVPVVVGTARPRPAPRHPSRARSDRRSRRWARRRPRRRRTDDAPASHRRLVDRARTDRRPEQSTQMRENSQQRAKIDIASTSRARGTHKSTSTDHHRSIKRGHR